MNVDGRPWRTIWLEADGEAVGIIDQTRLPHEFATLSLHTMEEAAQAIRTMQVRGAPLIGATAAYGLALALRDDASDENLARACDTLLATRPTAVNLRWALDDMRARLGPLGPFPGLHQVSAQLLHDGGNLVQEASDLVLLVAPPGYVEGPPGDLLGRQRFSHGHPMVRPNPRGRADAP